LVLVALTSAATAAGIGFRAFRTRRAVPQIATPPSLDDLEPQLREFVARHVKWAAEQPRDAERCITLGLVYAANKLWPEALSCFRGVTELRPDDPLPRYYLALCLLQTQDLAGAEAQLRRVTQGWPDFAAGHHQLGYLYLDQGRADRAAAEFDRVALLAPDQPHGYVGQAEAHLARHAYAEAALLLERARAIAPDLQSARYLLGLAYRGQGRVQEAVPLLQAGLGAERSYLPDPWTGRTLGYKRNLADQLRRAAALLQAKRPADAVTLLETVLRWHPDNLDVMSNLGIAYLDSGELDKARGMLAKALSRRPDYFPALINLAACEQRAGNLAEALRRADQAVAAAPQAAQAHVIRGRILRSLGRPQEAVSALTAGLRYSNDLPGVWLELGDLCFGAGRLVEAKGHYQTALRRLPGSIEARLQLAQACLALGHLEEAAMYLAQARRMDPDHPQVAALAKRLGR